MKKLNDEITPLVSIITVAFNAVDEIENTILSVLSQSYNNIEYIIVDGGSTDGTVDVIKKYSDKIDTWISEPDNGVYDAMNKGVKTAYGEWVNFMNCGDVFYNEEVVERLFEEPIDCTDVVVFGNTEFVTKKGNRIVKYGDFLLHKYMPACHQSIFCRRRELVKRPFDIAYKIAADLDFFYHLSPEYKFKYVNIIVSRYNAIYGISTSNEIGTLKEILKITSSSKLEYCIKYFFNRSKIVIRNLLINTKLVK